MAIPNLQRLLRERDAQYGNVSDFASYDKQEQPVQQNGDEEALKLFFDYLEKSNKQIMSLCTTILNNQKMFETKIDEINKKLEKITPEE